MSKSDDLTPDLARALEGTVKVARYLSETDALDEETLTGTVLGALCASMGYESQLADPKHNQVEGKFFWARYNKGTAQNGHSEAYNGADFALVFVDEQGQSRIAIFQAKRGKVSKAGKPNGPWSLETFHRTKNRNGALVPQMEPLTRASRAIQLSNLASRPLTLAMITQFYASDPLKVSGLSWVHYLAYVNGTPLCFPLSGMQSLLDESRIQGAKSAKLTFSLTHQITTMFEVLEDGLASKPKHWLQLKDEESVKALPTLIDLMPVYFSGHLDKLTLRLAKAFSTQPDAGSGYTPG